MAESLASKACVPCTGGVPPLTAEQIRPLLARLEGWSVEGEKKLRKTYRFADFARAVAWVNRAADIAEAEGHHPDLHLSWGRVVVECLTHAIGGLSENDVILAAKLDQAFTS